MQKPNLLVQKALESIDRLVETVKLKRHLASMELQDAWKDLEQEISHVRHSLESFYQSIHQESDEARLQSHLALMEAKQRWEGLSDELDQVVHAMANEVGAQFDHARIKLALAKMETREALHTEELEQYVRTVGHKLKDEWYLFLTHFDERVVDFINRFPMK